MLSPAIDMEQAANIEGIIGSPPFDWRPTVSLGKRDQRLTDGCHEVIERARKQHCYNSQRISASVLTAAGDGQMAYGDAGGEDSYYPASVVKLFHLVYMLAVLDAAGETATPELHRGMNDMIRDSCNDATALVVDTYSGAFGGSELPLTEFTDWLKLRRQIDKFFFDSGLSQIIVCQKTWNEGPYGREQQARGPNGELRNRLSPDAALSLLAAVMAGPAFQSNESHQHALSLLKRQIPADGPGADHQSAEYSGKILPAGSQLWSKSGWTDEVRHDVAWVRLPSGQEAGWAIFTEGLSESTGIIPETADHLLRLVQSRS